MKISIVVPAFNEERLLAASLAAIQHAARTLEPAATWELVVCDNNSTDRTAEIARGAGATVVFEPVNQIARARNCGAAAASGEWLIFVDADSFPSPRLFSRTLELMNHPRCAGGGCLVRLDENLPMANCLVALWNTLSRNLGWAAGSFIFCETRLFRGIGGFSDHLYASEEIDLCRRLKRAARQENRHLRIITDERLVTSARKMHLYSKMEHLRFMLKAILFPKRVLGNREECTLWYNGRR
jgi:glycosyltransferase involved in cell wall biosynthesis